MTTRHAIPLVVHKLRRDELDEVAERRTYWAESEILR
jgi:hypothetical protein